MRAGDTVHHRPSGEDWVVAYVDGDRLAWCGWPPGDAAVADCELVEACTDDAHRQMLEEWARRSRHQQQFDRRQAVCRRQLFELNQGYLAAGI